MLKTFKPRQNKDSDSIFFILVRAFDLLTKPEKAKTLLVVLIQFFLSLLDLLGIVLFGILGSLTINGLTSNNSGDKTKFVLEQLGIFDNTLQQQVIYIAILGTLLLTAKTLFSLYFTKRTLHFLSRRAAEISSILISKLLSKSLIYIQKNSSQKTIYMATEGVTAITVGIIGSLVYLVSDVSLLLVLSLGLFYVDPLVAFSTIIIFGSVAFFLYKFMHKNMSRYGQIQYELEIKSAEKIGEIISSYRELFVKNRRNFYAKEIRELRFNLSSAIADLTFYQRISKYVLELTIIVSALIMAIIQFSTQTTSHAIGVLSIFLIASTRIGPAVLRIQQVFLTIKASFGTSRTTFTFLDELSEGSEISLQDSPMVVNHEGFIAEVLLDKVSFSYSAREIFAVSEVNFHIKPGTITSIVGTSGAGKTTLVDLILGILTPDQGNVTINNLKPISAITKWPGAISYVPQDIIIINGTIKENVALGYIGNEFDEQKVYESLKIAQLSEFINSLPDGINTYVGDRGVKISGGQRQRLGIARAMFTKPSLLILDEATSSLDGITESYISDAIQAMRGDVTVIMIAHRLSTVRNSDLVIYMDQGKIITTGNFDEVRKKVPNFDQQARLMGL
jgi:ABC-type multidrug transport system fused ATPase/permease subunit